MGILVVVRLYLSVQLQENQPLDLDVHARAIQARLGQVVRQRRGHRAVAPVQRAERLTPARQVRIAVGSGEQCHRVAHTPYLPRKNLCNW